MRRFLAVVFGQTLLRVSLSATGLGRMLTFDSAALVVIAVRIVRPSLPVSMSLITSNLLVVSYNLGGKCLEIGGGFAHACNGRRADVQALYFRPPRMLKSSRLRIDFAHQDAFAHQLGAPSEMAFDGAPHKPDVFDAVGQPIGDDRIVVAPETIGNVSDPQCRAPSRHRKPATLDLPSRLPI